MNIIIWILMASSLPTEPGENVKTLSQTSTVHRRQAKRLRLVVNLPISTTETCCS